MPRPKRVLCIMDLAVVGRASLAVIGPVLAGCGMQACPLPAALFSSHTGGFGEVQKRDLSEFGFAALHHYAEQQVAFDAIYVGYLYTKDQFLLAQAAFGQYPDAVHIVDPALGDNGRLYEGLSQDTVEQMRKLYKDAHILTPNYSESAWLTGKEPTPGMPLDPEELAERMQILSGTACSVLVTSVPAGEEDTRNIVGCRPGGREPYVIHGRHSPGDFPGTGDLFTATLTGLYLKGLDLPEAARRAVAFVQAAVHTTYEGGGEAREGVWYEPVLPMLADY